MNRKPLIYTAVVLAVILLVAALISIQSASGLHLVSSNPKNNSSDANQYTTVSFTFNQPLAHADNITNEITVEPAITGSTTVDGKTATFAPTTNFQPGTYTARMKTVTGSQGSHISNVKMVFTAKSIDFNQLPAATQKKLIEKTDAHEPAYSINSMAIYNTNDILARGVTADQVSAMQQLMFNYFTSKGLKPKNITISNVVKAPRDRESVSMANNITFTSLVDQATSYGTHIEYEGFSQLRLIFTDPKNGGVLYDSGAFRE